MKFFSSFLRLMCNCRVSLPRLLRNTDSGNHKFVSLPRSSSLLKDRLVFIRALLLKWKIRLVNKMSTESTISLPSCIRGMKVLDRDAFTGRVTAVGLKVPVYSIEAVRKHYKHWLLKVPKLHATRDLPDSDPDRHTHRLLLLSPNFIKPSESFGEGGQTFLTENGVDLTDIQQHDFKLTYENFTYDDVLDAVLPSGMSVGGFSVIGHIAHLNLKDTLLEYKYIIGQVILDKITTVKTVVHKTQNIDNTFRNFAMEVIAGERDFITVAREHGFSYKMDFSKVYWNSRLGTEHQRIVQLLKCGDVLYDIFAGVGPFVVPAAKKGCRVIANDLNPDSVHWLQQNVDLNKVKDKVRVYNMDGVEFISSVIKPDLLQHCSSTPLHADSTFHIVMNLPSLAVDFLKCFRGLLRDAELPSAPCTSLLPVIHCYSFSRADDPAAEASERTADALGITSFEELQDRDVRIVRNVAPGKQMLCVTFRLPWHVLAATERGMPVF